MIVSGGLRLGGVIGNGQHAVGEAWEFAEESGEFGVAAFADVAVAAQQIVGVGVGELFVGAEEGEEFVKAAFETGFGDDLVHLGADAFDFGEAERVDLIGSQIGGGDGADVEGVPGFAVGNVAERDAFARAGNVFVGHEIVELRECGKDFFLQRSFSGSAKTGLIRSGNLGGEFFEIDEERALGGVGFELILHLLRHVAKRDARWSDSGGKTFLEQDDGLIHDGGDAVETCNHVFVIFHSGVRRDIQHASNVLLDTVELRDLKILAGETRAFEGLFVITFVEVVVQLVGGGESVALDGGDDFEWRMKFTFATFDGGE